MQSSPTEITLGVSGMTIALNPPPSSLSQATRTEPRARDGPPAVFRVIGTFKSFSRPMAFALRRYFIAIRFEPHPVSMMNLMEPSWSDPG